jgi:hypothetical protein
VTMWILTQTDLFRKMNKVPFTVVCAGTRLKKCAKGEQCQEGFENCATGVVLVGIRDIASDDMGYKTIAYSKGGPPRRRTVPIVVNVSVIPGDYGDVSVAAALQSGPRSLLFLPPSQARPPWKVILFDPSIDPLRLAGEAVVGKSSVVLRFVWPILIPSLTPHNLIELRIPNELPAKKWPTIGAAFLTQRCHLEDRVLRYEIWDTASQERFHPLAVSAIPFHSHSDPYSNLSPPQPTYYRNTQAACTTSRRLRLSK